MTRSAVFLDRDGVLNRAIVRAGRPHAPLGLDEFELLPEAGAAVVRLKAAGFLAIVVTNQPDVGAGRQSPEILGAMHARLRAAMPLDDIRVCTCAHDCPCYKPRPGLLFDAAREWGIALDRSFMVGDRWRDVGAGRAAGCTTYFIDRGYDEPLRERPDFVVADLAEAARHILGRGPLGETGGQ